MSALTFYMKLGKNGEFYWTLAAANHKKIATSGEGDKARVDWQRALGLLVNGCRTAEVVDATKTPNEPLGRGSKLFPPKHDAM